MAEAREQAQAGGGAEVQRVGSFVDVGALDGVVVSAVVLGTRGAEGEIRNKLHARLADRYVAQLRGGLRLKKRDVALEGDANRIIQRDDLGSLGDCRQRAGAQD